MIVFFISTRRMGYRKQGVCINYFFMTVTTMPGRNEGRVIYFYFVISLGFISLWPGRQWETTQVTVTGVCGRAAHFLVEQETDDHRKWAGNNL